MIKYDLHDSLIEKVSYLADKKRVDVRIELCNWQQDDYKDSDPEMLNICMTFDEVEKFELTIDNYEFNNNEILDVIEVDARTTKIVFLTESDAEMLIITAKQISYTY